MLTENMETEENNFLKLDDSLPNPILNINTTLIRPEETKKYSNRLTEDIKYEKAGSNGVFEALPKLVKIKGFELNKKVTVKIQLINKSKFSQRVSIIPPTTPFFKIKYSRRGLIAPGLSEVIFLSFTPQNYVYYYDFIRILCEGDKMIIPIHAFPRMNIHASEYVPKFIDFGTVGIGTGYHKEIMLKNIIDVPFEFELVPVKGVEEIKIEPVVGDIEALSNKIISIKFYPNSYGFFQAEYEFRLSEMDYKPSIIIISGSCNSFDKVLNENIIKHMKRLKENPDVSEMSKSKLKSSSRFNLDGEMENMSAINLVEIKSVDNDKSKSQINMSSVAKLKLNDSPEKNVNQSVASLVNNNSSVSLKSSPKGIAKKFKNFPSNKEREFLNFFNTVDTTIKDKEIKYIRFVGRKLLTDEETNKIINDRVKEFEDNLMIKRKIDLARHYFETDTEKCSVDRKNKYLLSPTFDFNQNDKFFKTRHYFNVFLKNMTKVLINNRAESRLNKLKDMITKNAIKSPDDFGNYVEKDWINQFNRESGKKDDKVKLKFIAPRALSKEEVYLSYDYNLESMKQAIAHENNINLDELREFENVERSEVEVIGYKEFKSNGMTLYEVSTQEKTMRICAENEQPIRGQRGDSELAFEKINSLFDLPASYKYHIETGIDTLLFNNPSFKKFVPYNAYPETSIDYNLQPRQLPNSDDFYSNFSNELYMKYPLSIYENLPIREIDNQSLIGDTSLDFIHNKIKTSDQRDLFIKKSEKVDEDNFIFELIKDDEDKLLMEFEKDDEVIRNVRELNREEVYDMKTKEKLNLEKRLQAEKHKMMATVPTVLEFYNSGVVNPNNKFLI